MKERFSKQTVKDYLVERIEFLEKENKLAITNANEPIILRTYGEYSALVKALYDLLKVVY